MSKKILACILITSLFMFQIFPQKQAEAVLPLAIPAAAYYVIGAALVACGVYATTSDGLDVAIQDCWESMSDDVKKSLAKVTFMGIAAYHILSDIEWEEIFNFAKENYEPGQQSKTKTGTRTGQMITFVNQDFEAMSGMTTFTINGHVLKCTSTLKTTSPNTYDIKVYVDNLLKNTYTVNDSQTNTFPPYWKIQWDNTTPVTYAVYLRILGTAYSWTGFKNLTPQTEVTISTGASYTYDNAGVLNNPAHDWLNEKTGDRRVACPPGLADTATADSVAEGAVDGLIGKTLDDVISGQIGDVVSTGVDTTTETGLLSGVWQALNGILSKVIEIADFLTPKFPDIGDGFDKLIAPFKNIWDDKVPNIPDLDTSQFKEKQISWEITIHHPIEYTFSVLDPGTVEEYRPTIKSWSGGILILFTLLWVVKKLPEIVEV